jgi:hypothetical protein
MGLNRRDPITSRRSHTVMYVDQADYIGGTLRAIEGNTEDMMIMNFVEGSLDDSGGNSSVW